MNFLVVDDSLTTCKMVVSMLEDLGHTAEFCVDPNNALKKLESCGDGTFDILISDLLMPGIDGFKLLEIIREKQEFIHLPVIALTNKRHVDDIIQGFRKGFNHYIPKPTNKKELSQAIKTVLEQKESNGSKL